MAYLGVDIGGTKTIVAIADDSGEIIGLRRLITPRSEGPARVLGEIEASLQSLIEETVAEKIYCVAIGCGGPLDREKGIILTAPNLPGWDNLPLSAYFENAFGVRTIIDNDVNLMALGEAVKGAGSGVDYMAYFNIGTGIGGGIVINGRLYRGCGNAGEFGHQIILPEGPRCLCGRHGCLEALASGTSIARRARECEDISRSAIIRYATSAASITAEHVALAARDGDELALRIWRETGEYLGLGVANVVNILNPRLVIIGGGVANAGDLLFEPVRRTVATRAMKRLASDVTILPGSLGEKAGIIGAIQLAMESHLSNREEATK